MVHRRRITTMGSCGFIGVRKIEASSRCTITAPGICFHNSRSTTTTSQSHLCHTHTTTCYDSVAFTLAPQSLLLRSKWPLPILPCTLQRLPSPPPPVPTLQWTNWSSSHFLHRPGGADSRQLQSSEQPWPEPPLELQTMTPQQRLDLLLRQAPSLAPHRSSRRCPRWPTGRWQRYP